MSKRELNLYQKVTRFKFRNNRYYDVYVTQINYPSEFYVRLAIINFNDLHSLEVCGAQLRMEDLKINRIVVYFSESLGKWTRGRICQRIPEGVDIIKYTMHAIDYGNYDYSVLYENIFDCGGDKSVDALAHLCQLSNCFPTGGSPWDIDATDAMRNYIGQCVIRMHVRTILEHRLIVDITVKAIQVDVRHWLITNRLALFHYPDENEKPHPASGYREYTFQDLPVGEIQHVRVQAASSMENFFVAKHEDYGRYLAERDEFTRYCEEQEVLMPNEVLQGRAVGYRCPHEETIYERACILAVRNSGKKAVIQLLDWGDKMEVKNTELKKLDFMKIRNRPAVAIYCTSVAVEESQRRDHDQLCPGIEFYIEVKRSGNEFAVPHIVEIKNNI